MLLYFAGGSNDNHNLRAHPWENHLNLFQSASIKYSSPTNALSEQPNVTPPLLRAELPNLLHSLGTSVTSTSLLLASPAPSGKATSTPSFKEPSSIPSSSLPTLLPSSNAPIINPTSIPSAYPTPFHGPKIRANFTVAFEGIEDSAFMQSDRSSKVFKLSVAAFFNGANENNVIIYSSRNIQPTLRPTIFPTSSIPTSNPTSPSSIPTSFPTSSCPSSRPSSTRPTSNPTSQPSRQPFLQPTTQPSRQPTKHPSSQPSQRPTKQPTFQPSVHPSSQPSNIPTSTPSTIPTAHPTPKPTPNPTRTFLFCLKYKCLYCRFTI